MLKVYANYGAMFPSEELTVHTVIEGNATAINSEGETRNFNVNDIRAERPTSGSPIGVYWDERDAY